MSLMLDDAIAYIARKSEQEFVLSELDKIILECAWEDETYKAASEKHSVSYNTLQAQAGPSLWRALSIALDKKVGKKTFRRVISLEIAEESRRGHREESEVACLGASLPSVDDFVGREKEIAYLWRLMHKSSCVMVVGVEGIGKKSLVSKMLRFKQRELPLKRVLWKPLYHRPTVAELEAELQSAADNSDNPNEKTLLDKLRSKPCLIILDSFDSVLSQAGEQTLKSSYISLVRRITQETSSKVIITSSQLTEETEDLVLRNQAAVYSLKGLNLDEAKAVLGNQWNSKSAEKIWEATGGNPLMLREVSQWSEHAKNLTSRIDRLTVLSGLVGGFYERVFRKLNISSSEMTLLKKISVSTNGVLLSDLFDEEPSSIPAIKRLLTMGLASMTNANGNSTIRTSPLVGRAVTGM